MAQYYLVHRWDECVHQPMMAMVTKSTNNPRNAFKCHNTNGVKRIKIQIN